MLSRTLAPRRGALGSTVLIGSLIVLGIVLAAWKTSAIKKSAAAAANQPEPMETATAAVASRSRPRFQVLPSSSEMYNPPSPLLAPSH